MNRIRHFYASLRKKHGSPSGQWVLWCRRPKILREKEQVIIEAILTQRANWKNVELAVHSLEDSGCMSLRAVADANPEMLAQLVRPSGFYHRKAERLRTLAGYLLNDCGGMERISQIPLGQLREGLLSLNGIGPETADDILLYAFERPVFVIDEYTRRIAIDRGLASDFSYSGLQETFSRGVRKDYRLYQDFHALIVIEGKVSR